MAGMRKLTYGNQMVLGILLVALGHILAAVTDKGFFMNLGWISYGLLFLIHPVWSREAATHPKSKTYVRIAGAVVVLIGLVVRNGTGNDFWQSRVSENLGIDAGKASVLTSYDDHSGFHGDGTSYAVLSFGEQDMKGEISAAEHWYALPMPKELQTLLYGEWTPTKVTGPFVGVTIPKVDQGFYYFFDRQGDTHSVGEVLDRGSFNYTVAIYDLVKNELIYCEYDT